MLPGNSLSTTPVPSRFFGSRSSATSATVDYEEGGVALNDPSQGLLVQRWRARLFNAGKPDSYVMLDAPLVPEFVWLTVAGMTQISFSFDANMQPVVAYVSDDRAYLNWYDSQVAQHVTTQLAPDVVTPRVSLDDKRFLGSDGYRLSDVILAYVRGTNLYYRQQRDRYGVERLLATGVKPLIKIGMNRQLRMQFMSEV